MIGQFILHAEVIWTSMFVLSRMLRNGLSGVLWLESLSLVSLRLLVIVPLYYVNGPVLVVIYIQHHSILFRTA